MTDPVRDTQSHGTCRVCRGEVLGFLDLGRQPLSNAFLRTEDVADEYFYQLAVGMCGSCLMVQLMEEVPRRKMFHDDYPYYSYGSSVMREHFTRTARHFVENELTGRNPFVVELGCNDGVMLRHVREAGIRHLGFEPSGKVADVARSAGLRVRDDFFEESTAVEARKEHGPADLIYGANTVCHIPYIDSVFRGVDALLSDDGLFVFEDPYLGDVLEKTSFDQIYDEHFFFFSAVSVRAMARRQGFELVDVERLPVHGGEVRYSIARAGVRTPSEATEELIAWEEAAGLNDLERLGRFSASVGAIRDELRSLLGNLAADGKRVMGYGATAKSATVTNYCGLGPDLVSWVCDTTPAKQGLLTPGAHIPVHSSDRFSAEEVDYALLFAWNHADEILGKEQAFRDAGGQWILYVPHVSVR